MGKRKPRLDELSIDAGLRSDQLYLTSVTKQGAFDTAAPPGVCRLDIKDFELGKEAQPPMPGQQRREVRGMPVRPIDDAKLRKEEAKDLREQRLEGWFGLPKRQLTPQLEKELKALRLRANVDP